MRFLRWLKFLPKAIRERGKFRHLLSRVVKKVLGYSGYFQLYNIPLQHTDIFDYCEKKDLFVPGGLNRGETIFDLLDKAETKFHVSNWRDSEEENLAALQTEVEQGKISFAFLYWAAMDGLLHQVGKESSKVDQKLLWYEEKLRKTIAQAQAQYKEVRLFICSDHGMATVTETINVMERIEATGLNFGKDYVAVYDSTMARFWFKNSQAKEQIETVLATIPQGRLLPKNELKTLGCDFPGAQYGEEIFLLNPGVLVVPSHMGLKPITGMHGYHPDHPDSEASLLSNVPVSPNIKSIPDIFTLMRSEAGV